MVQLGTRIAELETEKVNVEITAQRSGRIGQLLVQEGTQVAPGQPLTAIASSLEAPSNSPPHDMARMTRAETELVAVLLETVGLSTHGARVRQQLPINAETAAGIRRSAAEAFTQASHFGARDTDAARTAAEECATVVMKAPDGVWPPGKAWDAHADLRHAAWLCAVATGMHAIAERVRREGDPGDPQHYRDIATTALAPVAAIVKQAQQSMGGSDVVQ